MFQVQEEGLILANDQEKLQKQIEILSKSIQTLELTGDDKDFLELSKRYRCDRQRIHKEILRKYANLFDTIEIIRKLSILGVQNIDFLVQNNEADFKKSIRRYQALKPMMIKYRDILDEIICLVQNGFTDGAMQRWRTFLEYSVIIIFILEQGEEAADEFTNNFVKSINDGLRPRTNFAWAKAADCLKEEKQINIKMLLKNIHGIDTKYKVHCLAIYKLVCQLIHGSSLGINMSFNDDMSEEINDLNTQSADKYIGGISTAISYTMYLLSQTYIIFFNVFPNGGLNVKNLWVSLINEYIKAFKDSDLQ